MQNPALVSIAALALFSVPALSQSEFDPPPEGGCYSDRGSFDCGANQVCVYEGDVDDAGGIGTCEDGDSSGNLFTTCSSSFQCEGGLCEGGVCTVPCDVGCPANYSCDADAITGGLCVPEACSSDDDCGDGMACYDTDGGKMCLTAAPIASTADDTDAAAGCSSTGASSAADGGLAALLGALFIARRRRR